MSKTNAKTIWAVINRLHVISIGDTPREATDLAGADPKVVRKLTRKVGSRHFKGLRVVPACPSFREFFLKGDDTWAAREKDDMIRPSKRQIDFVPQEDDYTANRRLDALRARCGWCPDARWVR